MLKHSPRNEIEAEMKGMKLKMNINFSWDLTNSFTSILNEADDEDEEDNIDDILAHRDQILRLKVLLGYFHYF